MKKKHEPLPEWEEDKLPLRGDAAMLVCILIGFFLAILGCWKFWELCSAGWHRMFG